MPLATLRTHFEERYLPTPRFVAVSTAEIVDPQVVAISNPDDVPMGQLAKLIAPRVVLSEDKDLRGPGIAPDDWRGAARFAIDVAEGAASQAITSNRATLPIRGGVELVKLLGR